MFTLARAWKGRKAFVAGQYDESVRLDQHDRGYFAWRERASTTLTPGQNVVGILRLNAEA